MNLLCPNCQKMLTVPEQYAGQLMKCPLCAGTFTVPGLPPAAPMPSSPAPMLPPSQPEVFSVKAEAPPTPAITTSPTIAPNNTATTGAPAPASPSLPPRPPGGPVTFSVWFKPEIVKWIAPGALVLMFFIMLFFPWIGVYPGGQAAAWQYAYQIPFGFFGEDVDLQKPPLNKEFHFTSKEDAEGKLDNRPGFDFLMLLYWPMFLLTLAVTIGFAVLPALKLKLPPNVEPLLQWGWGIVAVLNLFLFLLLCLQLVWGFSLENSIYTWKTEQSGASELAKLQSRDTIQEKQLAALKGQARDVVKSTVYLKFTILLQLIAILGAALMLALEQRHKPTPVRLDLVV
jgi:hypothetical protein